MLKSDAMTMQPILVLNTKYSASVIHLQCIFYVVSQLFCWQTGENEFNEYFMYL